MMHIFFIQRIITNQLASEKVTYPQLKELLLGSLLGRAITAEITNRNGVTASGLTILKGNAIVVKGFTRTDCLINQVIDGAKLEYTSTHTQITHVNEPAIEEQVNAIDESWQQSLADEFNQSMILETTNNEQPECLFKENTNVAAKRPRGMHSLNNTPSAPVRTKAKREPDLFKSPLVLSPNYCTPVRLRRENNSNNNVCASPLLPTDSILRTSTPREKYISKSPRTLLNDPSRDLFSDSDTLE